MPQVLHVLMVEDNPLDAELVLRALRHAGFEPVWECVDTEAAYLDLLRPNVEIVLSDFQMPQFSGLRALELLKESEFDIPFILISGTIGEDIAVEAMKLGAADYLLKDRLARLGPAISHALEQGRLLRERKLAREALEKSERELRELAAQLERERARLLAAQAVAKMGSWDTDLSTLEVICSVETFHIFETDPARFQPTHQRLLEFVHPDDRAMVREAFIQSVDQCSACVLEHRLLMADGRVKFVEERWQVFPDEEGKPIRALGTCRDITEHKLAEEALRWETAFFEAQVDCALDGMLVVDNHGKKILQNRRMNDLWKIPPHIAESSDDAQQLRFVTNRAKNPRQFMDKVLYLNSHPDEVSRDEIEVVDGTVLDRYSAPVRDKAGKHYGRIWTFRDVTERKRAEEAIRESEERFSGAFEYAPIGVALVSPDGRWLKVNRALCELVGYSEAGLLSRTFQDITHPEDLKADLEKVRQILAGEIPSYAIEKRYVHARGHFVPVLLNVSLVRDTQGQPLYFIAQIQDITEERNREEKLAEALSREKELAREAQAGNRAKNEFLAVMSHEIRTPMNGILGFAELLASAPNLPADCRDYVKTITSSGEALLRILDDILDFSRLEAGGLKVEKSLFSSREILQDIHTLLVPHASDKHLEFQVEIEEGVPEQLWNDAGRLRQTLINLVGNAIKFTAQGSITLGIRSSRNPSEIAGSEVEFFVRDTAQGIPEEAIALIFEPFVQADSSISRRFGGTGLGLSISRNLVALMGGKLTVQSKVDEGSEFCVSLPVGLPEGLVPPVIPGDPVEVLDESFAASHPMSILLVEDDRVNLKLMQLMLRRLGYESLTAQDGIEAVEVYQRERPDCILMDLQMPRKDGLWATSEIRKIEKATPRDHRVFISALTANILEENRRQCFEAGMDGYLNKPIKCELLAKILEQAGERKSPGVPSSGQFPKGAGG